jgi:hypothetical protein
VRFLDDLRRSVSRRSASEHLLNVFSLTIDIDFSIALVDLPFCAFTATTSPAIARVIVLTNIAVQG